MQWDLTPKPASESETVLVQAMELTDANLSGNVHGGVIMKLCDAAAGISAVKHCGSRVVTAAMDEMSFIEPVFLGEILTLRAQVNDVGRTSMEVGVRVETENLLTGVRRHTNSCYLTFVAVDRNGKPVPVPRLKPETADEIRRYDAAKQRRERRLQERISEGRD